jgi:hypothetical protein
MAVSPKTIASWGLLGPDPEIVEGMDITLTDSGLLQVTLIDSDLLAVILEADEITVEIDES